MSDSPLDKVPDRVRTRGLRPRDAATLIILRRDGLAPRVLMGKRHAGHKFMPNKFVFPGGRMDAADCRVRPGRDLDPAVMAKLLLRMRGGPSATRARGLAMAAVRETFEEVGLRVACRGERAPRSAAPAWRRFLADGHAPDLSGLRYLARAITPPGRVARFDARFFVVDAAHVANLDAPAQTASEELLEIHWLSLAEAHRLELPHITREVLRLLESALADARGLAAGAPVSFQYLRGKTWQLDAL